MEFETDLQRRVDTVINEMTDYLTDWENQPDFVDDLIERWQRILLQIDDWEDDFCRPLNDLLREEENE